MEFAKYYNVSDIVNQMQVNEEIDCYLSGEDKFKGVYVCMDMISGSVEFSKDTMRTITKMKISILWKETELVFTV